MVDDEDTGAVRSEVLSVVVVEDVRSGSFTTVVQAGRVITAAAAIKAKSRVLCMVYVVLMVGFQTCSS